MELLGKNLSFTRIVHMRKWERCDLVWLYTAQLCFYLPAVFVWTSCALPAACCILGALSETAPKLRDIIKVYGKAQKTRRLTALCPKRSGIVQGSCEATLRKGTLLLLRPIGKDSLVHFMCSTTHSNIKSTSCIGRILAKRCWDCLILIEDRNHFWKKREKAVSER